MRYFKELCELENLLCQLEKTGLYDVDKLMHSILHLVTQLEYFYGCLVAKGENDVNSTFYQITTRPKEHQLAYFNIGRGFPKELMDGHWCLILKDLGSKMIVVPSTSIKKDSRLAHPLFELDVEVMMNGKKSHSRIQLSDIRSVDIQRLDVRKPFCDVLTPKKIVTDFIKNNLFDE